MGLIDSHPEKYLPRTDSALDVIDRDHASIVRGRHWTATHTETSVGGTVVSVLIAAPASGTYDLEIAVEIDAASTWAFSEVPEASGGTVITGICNNRTSDTADPLTITHTPTYISSGTVLENHLTSTITGGTAELHNPWRLAVSTEYLIYITVASNVTAMINLHYEGS